MLYIGNNKIIKGYIGDIPVTHVSLGNRSLIKLELNVEKTFTPKCTDFSVLPGSTIIIEYTSEGVSSSDITVTYDESFFTKDGDSFTLIAEGYSEITYNVKGLPSVVIRVATTELEADKGATLDYTSSLPSYPSHIDATYYISSKTYNFSIRSKYVTASSKNETALWSYSPRNATCSGFLKLDMSDLKGLFYISVTYSSESSSSNDTFKIYMSESSILNTSVLNTLVSTWGNKSNVTVKSPSYSKAGSYYLHFSSTKKSSYGSDYLLGIKEIKIIHTRETSVYPATQIESSTIYTSPGRNFTLSDGVTLIPSNANESLSYSFDSPYAYQRDDNTFLLMSQGNFTAKCQGRYASGDIQISSGPGDSQLVLICKSTGENFNPTVHSIQGASNDWWDTIQNYGDNVNTLIATATVFPTSFKLGDTSNARYLAKVDYLHTKNLKDMSFMFYQCSNLESIRFVGNVSNVTDLSYTFGYCSKLTSLSLNDWDTSRISNMNSTFSDCSTLSNLEINLWNTSMVNDMNSMFSYCRSLTSLDLSSWDFSNVTNTSYMFRNCSSLYDLYINNYNDSWNISNMQSMFSDCSSLYSIDLSYWYTYNLQDTSYMFNNCSNLYEVYLNNFDMSQVWSTDCMFSGCSNLTYLHLDYCSYETVEKIITSSEFPEWNSGIIYCSSDVYNSGLTPPGCWTFEIVW